MNFKDPRELSKNLVLNFPNKPVTTEMLDKEVRTMFKNREEGLNYINSNFANDKEAMANAIARLNRVYPENPKRPLRPMFEAGRLDKDGQVIDNDAQFFDDEDSAVSFADSNGYDYVTGYTYKYDDDTEPNGSFEVWKRGM